jgi:hypothetical protein
MGDVNQKLYLQHFVKNVEGAILEIGSRDYGNTQNFRELFPNNEYIGIDLSVGKGVDYVLDLTKTTGSLQKNYFSLIICCSVLEHTPVPWIMAQNMDSLLRGVKFIYFSALGLALSSLSRRLLSFFSKRSYVVISSLSMDFLSLVYLYCRRILAN